MGRPLPKNKAMTKKELGNKYTDTLLEEGKRPLNVYKYCKSIGIEEGEFYEHFASFQAIEKWVFVHFYQETLRMLGKSEDFKSYQGKEKLLSFYYTFFELLSANRSLVFMLLDHKKPVQAMNQLAGLKKEFSQMIDDLSLSQIHLPIEKAQELQEKGLKEAIWVQFMTILRYWLKDESPSFEKTDLFIEKSTAVGFDLLEFSPWENIVDLGKFLFKDALKK